MAKIPAASLVVPGNLVITPTGEDVRKVIPIDYVLEYIKKYMPLVFAQNVNVLQLQRHTEYLDDNGLVGWSCIISNYSGGDLQIYTNINWYSTNYSVAGSPIIINKYATCRLTLVYSSIDSEYLWTLSQN